MQIGLRRHSTVRHCVSFPITVSDAIGFAQAIFLKFDLFTKRLNKLIGMFTTIHQFSSLEQHTHIEGLEQMIRSLNNIIDDVKRKPYDLLDFFRNQFDRDYLEFNVNIHDLEIQLQGFVNASFEHITSTEHALSLLQQFQAILQRDTLRQDLESKWVQGEWGQMVARGALVSKPVSCVCRASPWPRVTMTVELRVAIVAL